jgi:putative transposase
LFKKIGLKIFVKKMLLAEQIHLKPSQELSHICHLAKNLYNLANFYVRQEYINLGLWLRYGDLNFILKNKKHYRKLPSQTSQQILRVLDKNWKSYFNSLKKYRIEPQKFMGRPGMPNYKAKNGESLVIFTDQQCKIKNRLLLFPRKNHSRYSSYWLKPIKTRIKRKLHHVRIKPLGVGYKLEIVYEKEIQDLGLDKKQIIGIDLGVTNIVTIVNNIGLKPIIVKGGVVKSINQFYNKEKSRLTSIKAKQNIKFQTRKLKKLEVVRNKKIFDCFHKISKNLIKYCLKNNIGTIVIGYNEKWKQNSNMGKRNNQNFASIPFLELIQKIQYKGSLIGIQVVLINEAYTSKCSFLDNEEIKKHKKYLGKRIKRGLFKASDGTIINADVNGGYNILKQGIPNAFADGIEGVELHPCSLNWYN